MKLIRPASKQVYIIQKILTRYTWHTPVYPQFELRVRAYAVNIYRYTCIHIHIYIDIHTHIYIHTYRINNRYWQDLTLYVSDIS